MSTLIVSDAMAIGAFVLSVLAMITVERYPRKGPACTAEGNTDTPLEPACFFSNYVGTVLLADWTVLRHSQVRILHNQVLVCLSYLHSYH